MRRWNTNTEDAHTDKKIQEKRIGNEERLRERLKAMEPADGNPHVYDNVFKTMTKIKEDEQNA